MIISLFINMEYGELALTDANQGKILKRISAQIPLIKKV